MIDKIQAALIAFTLVFNGIYIGILIARRHFRN